MTLLIGKARRTFASIDLRVGCDIYCEIAIDPMKREQVFYSLAWRRRSLIFFVSGLQVTS